MQGDIYNTSRTRSQDCGHHPFVCCLTLSHIVHAHAHTYVTCARPVKRAAGGRRGLRGGLLGGSSGRGQGAVGELLGAGGASLGGGFWGAS